MPKVLPRDPRATRILSASAHEALARAREAIAGAQAEAERLVAAARADAAAVIATARADGLARGRAEAGALLAAAAVERDRFLAGAGPELVALALLVARKVLGEEPRTPAERTAALAARALREARDRRAVSVRVAPADAEAVRAALPEGIAVEADATLPPGGCALETPAGRVEAGLDAQLDEIARALAQPAPAAPEVSP